MLDDRLWKQIKELMPIPAVDIVIFNQQGTEVLLFRRVIEPAKGLLWTPGSRVQRDETLKNAAERVLFEETGLKLKSKGPLFTLDHIFSEAHHVASYFVVEIPRNAPIRLNEQKHDLYVWVNLKNLGNLHPIMKEAISGALVYISKGGTQFEY